MRGIKLSHGVSFVEYEGVTIRISADGKCALSPILLPSLEWELRTEPPEKWTYITDSDVDAYGENTRKQIENLVKKFHRTIK